MSRQIKVHRHIGIRRLTIQIGDGWEHYIEVCGDVRPHRSETVEVVKRGFVQRRFALPYQHEPETIIKILRQELR